MKKSPITGNYAGFQDSKLNVLHPLPTHDDIIRDGITTRVLNARAVNQTVPNRRPYRFLKGTAIPNSTIRNELAVPTPEERHMLWIGHVMNNISSGVITKLESEENVRNPRWSMMPNMINPKDHEAPTSKRQSVLKSYDASLKSITKRDVPFTSTPSTLSKSQPSQPITKVSSSVISNGVLPGMSQRTTKDIVADLKRERLEFQRITQAGPLSYLKRSVDETISDALGRSNKIQALLKADALAVGPRAGKPPINITIMRDADAMNDNNIGNDRLIRPSRNTKPAEASGITSEKSTATITKKKVKVKPKITKPQKKTSTLPEVAQKLDTQEIKIAQLLKSIKKVDENVEKQSPRKDVVLENTRLKEDIRNRIKTNFRFSSYMFPSRALDSIKEETEPDPSESVGSQKEFKRHRSKESLSSKKSSHVVKRPSLVRKPSSHSGSSSGLSLSKTSSR